MLQTGKNTEYIELVEKAMMGAGVGAELPLNRAIGRLIPLKATQQLFTVNHILSKCSQQAIRNARGANVRGNISPNVTAEAEKSNGKMDKENVSWEARNLIVAGSDGVNSMPIVVSNEGWVKLPPKQIRRPAKPADPVGILRGPLAYITGRPEFKEPVKKPSITQLLISAAVPLPVTEEKVKRSRDRVPSAPVASRSKQRAPTHIFEEADEEIPRPKLSPDDSQSRRSASPVGSRHIRAGPSVRSRRHEPSRIVYEEEDSGRYNRSRRHESSGSVYGEGKHSRSKHHLSSSRPAYYDDGLQQYHRSDRSERSYRDGHHDRHNSYAYGQSYANVPHMPQLQPIVIYSTQPSTSGCGGHHHGCGGVYQQHQCSTAPRPVIEAPVLTQATLPVPKPSPSVASSRSSASGASKAMSYQWYSATQPLKI